MIALYFFEHEPKVAPVNFTDRTNFIIPKSVDKYSNRIVFANERFVRFELFVFLEKNIYVIIR